MTSEVTYFPEALASHSEGMGDLVQTVFIFVFRRAALFDASRGTFRSRIVDVTYHHAFNRGSHLKTRHIRSHTEVLRDAQRFFIELCANPIPRTHNILAIGADNQHQMVDLSDYNVAHNSQNNPEYPRKHIHFISGFGAL